MVAEDLLDECGVDVGQTAAAQFLRPRHPDPARLPECARHLARVAVGEHPLASPLGIVGEQRVHRGGERCGLVAERELPLCQPEIHARRS